MIINVAELLGTKWKQTYVGKKTLEEIEKILKKEMKKGNIGIEVDLKDTSMRADFSLDIARMQYTYKCKFLNLGGKEDEIDTYISTGRFIKEKLGNVEYGRRFRRLVEMSDFPLMVKDNRGMGDELIQFNVIQPVSFDETHFHYNVIKPYLLEPGELEKAYWYENKNIWERESIHLTDIGEFNQGFRFANTVQEITILDILTGVIEGTLKGFWEG